MPKPWPRAAHRYSAELNASAVGLSQLLGFLATKLLPLLPSDHSAKLEFLQRRGNALAGSGVFASASQITTTANSMTACEIRRRPYTFV